MSTGFINIAYPLVVPSIVFDQIGLLRSDPSTRMFDSASRFACHPISCHISAQEQEQYTALSAEQRKCVIETSVSRFASSR